MDINYFIEKKKIKEVKSAKIEGRGGKLDSEGLFSEEIFGRVGSPIRKLTFGYIDLHVKIIHPQCWDMIVGLNPMMNKMLTGKKKYIINPDGDIEESTDSFIGMSGIKALIDNWDKLNLNLVGKKHPEYVKFLKNNKEKIFIDKILVIPAGIRDVQLNVGGTNKKIITSSEVNTLYEELLQQTKTVDSNLLDFLDDETVKNIVGAIQRKVIEINKWIEERLKGKNGILRGGLLSKTVDYSGRFNIVNDMSVKQGYIGVPWQAVLKLYEPFTIYHIIKNKYNVNVKELIKQQLNIENELSSSDLKRFLTLINEQPNIVSKELEDELVRIAEEITKDKMILYKRDPVENRNSYIAGYIRVDRNSLVIKLNPLDCPRQGADFDGDSINARINLLFLNSGIKNIHISEFKDVCNCEKINTHTSKNGATVTDYNVLDDVYIDAIDVNNGDIQKKKITNWSVHEHLNMWDIKKHNRNSLIPAIGEFKVSEDHSLIVLDMENESIKRTNIKDVIENKKKYAFIRLIKDNFITNQSNNKENYITYIPKSLLKQSNNLNLTADEKAAIRNNKFTQSRIIISNEDINKVQNESIRNILRLQNNQEIQILPCIYFDYEFDSNTTTAYDLTVEDYKTFTTEDGIFVYDTEALYPLFTKKANEEAKLYMNPRTSKSAWLSPENMTKSVYDLKLDAIATVYTVTKF